jgi:enoyl reductase-like protein
VPGAFMFAPGDACGVVGAAHGRVTVETDYFRLAGDPPKLGPGAFAIKVPPVFMSATPPQSNTP